MGLDLLTRLAVVRRQMASVAVLVAPVDAGFVGARALRDDRLVAGLSSVPVLGASEIPECLAQGSLLADGRRLLTIGAGEGKAAVVGAPMSGPRGRIGSAVAPMLVRRPVLGAKCGIRAALARCGGLWAASTSPTPRAAGAGPLGLRFAGG